MNCPCGRTRLIDVSSGRLYNPVHRDRCPGSRPVLKHMSVLGNCIKCGAPCPNGFCPNV